MGGYGSNRWGWYEPKTTVEACLTLTVWAIDIRPNDDGTGKAEWTRADGTVTNSVGLDVATGETGGTLTLGYRAGERLIQERVRLSTTRPHLGGLRWWFHCPRCQRRIGKLYKPPESAEFRCRQCHNLTYRKSQEHDKTHDKYLAMLLDGVEADTYLGRLRQAMALIDVYAEL